MQTKKIVVTSPLNFLPYQIARLKQLGSVVTYDTLPTSPEEWMSRTEGADIICSGKYGLKEGIYKRKNIFFSLPFVAVEWIDMEKIKANHSVVSYCPGCNSYAVSEWIITMTLLLMRKIQGSINVTKLKTKTVSSDNFSLAMKKACILGQGNVGSKVGEIYRAFGMEVVFFKRGDNLIKVIKNCDVVVNTLSNNMSAHGLLDRAFFNSFSGKTFFITVTSSKIYDAKAMLEALRLGKLLGVADDCASILPGNYDDPYYKQLINVPNVLATPHISYQSDTTVKIANDMMIDNVEAWINKKPINLLY